MHTNPDDLLILLEVSRSGKFTTAAHTLGLNHTTISRRIASLEKALGGHVLTRTGGGWKLTELGERAVAAAEQIETAVGKLGPRGAAPDPIAGAVRMTASDDFSAFIAAPAMVRLRSAHPRISVEINTDITGTGQQGSGADIGVMVGEPHIHGAEAYKLGDYMLGTYASKTYLDAKGTPATIEQLAQHPIIHFMDSRVHGADRDAHPRIPPMKDGLISTSVFVLVEATRAGAGIGFLPCFVGDLHQDLVRLIPNELNKLLPYWIVLRPDSRRRPAVAAVAQALNQEILERREALLGRPQTQPDNLSGPLSTGPSGSPNRD